LPALVWRLPHAMRCVASTPLGGGLGERHWVVNAQVPDAYDRTDVGEHLTEIAQALGCDGPGVGFLTAAAVERATHTTDGMVSVWATVGLQHPTWASSDVTASGTPVGTVNIVAFVESRMSDAAMVNAVITITEAKSQALLDHGVPGTGTASDAVCIAAHDEGSIQSFAGPRSEIGAALARATYAAVGQGTLAWQQQSGRHQ